VFTVDTFSQMCTWQTYGVATISRLLTIVCLFCKRALYKRRCSAKETYDFEEPTNHSHPISLHMFIRYRPILIYVYAVVVFSYSYKWQPHLYICVYSRPIFIYVYTVDLISYACKWQTHLHICVYSGPILIPVHTVDLFSYACTC